MFDPPATTEANVTSLTPDRRLQAAALADRIIYGAADTFHRQDAIALLALLPEPGFWRRLLGLLPGVRFEAEFTSRGLAGAAAGVGHVEADGEKRRVEVDGEGRLTFRAGQWRLYRSDGLLRPGRTTVTIEQVMATPVDDGRTAHLVFRRGEPKALLLEAVAEIGAGGAAVGLGVPRPWKTPMDGSRPGSDSHEAEIGTDRASSPSAT